MGYRSEVQAVIYGSKENLDAYLTAHLYIIDSLVMKTFKESLRRYVKEEYMTKRQIHILHMCEPSAKWYSDYPDVKAWMEFMYDSEEMNLEYEFIRIGEEDGDIEKKSSSDSAGFLYVYNPEIGNEFDDNDPIPLIGAAT